MINLDIDAAMRDDSKAVERLIRKSQFYMQDFDPQTQGKRFCVTRDGYMCLIPARAAKGDEICVFLGGSVPFVIRERDNGNYSLVGECYVHGLMDGEALDMVLDYDWLEEDIISLE